MVKANPHQCQINEAKNDVDMAMGNLKEIVKTSDLPINTLYNEAISKLKDGGIDMVVEVPEFRNIQHGLYNARNKSNGVLKLVCRNPEDVEVPSKFHSFIIADYCFMKNRIIIFCTQETKKLIPQITEFFFDGTFKSCPSPFCQLFTVHGDVGSSVETTNVVPLIFVLMCDKKQSSYSIVFNLLKQQLRWSPSKVHCDYEKAAINAIIEEFPTVTVIGCYYHWTRCVWRKANKLGITKSGVERRIVSLSSKLPLLPKDDILDAWQYIKSEALTDMNKFFSYFENLWIKEKMVKCITVFGQRHRTNNCVEGWNSKLNRAVNKNNVNILRLLNYLEKIDKETHIKIIKCNKGNVSNKRVRRDILKDDAIRHILMQYISKEINLGHALEKLANIK